MNDLDPDAILLAGVARGDQAATRRLVMAKLPAVYRLAQRILSDRTEAEDVAQEAMLRVWQQAGRWESGKAKLDTWLYTVVLNLCRDRLRRPKRHVCEVARDIAEPAPNVEATMLEDERGRSVAEAVRNLPERQREAILLVHYSDCSGAQAASVMDISIEALESLLARGRRTLRAKLRQDGM